MSAGRWQVVRWVAAVVMVAVGVVLWVADGWSRFGIVWWCVWWVGWAVWGQWRLRRDRRALAEALGGVVVVRRRGDG